MDPRERAILRHEEKMRQEAIELERLKKIEEKKRLEEEEQKKKQETEVKESQSQETSSLTENSIVKAVDTPNETPTETKPVSTETKLAEEPTTTESPTEEVPVQPPVEVVKEPSRDEPQVIIIEEVVSEKTGKTEEVITRVRSLSQDGHELIGSIKVLFIHYIPRASGVPRGFFR